MALTLVGRYDLGGAPYYPAMKDEGILIYASSSASIRKAIYGISDSALGTVSNPGNRSLPYLGEATISGDYYLPPFSSTPYAVPWMSAIHTTTGALTQSSPAIATWGSYQARTHVFPSASKTFQASLVANNGSVGSASTMHASVPPSVSTGWGSGSIGFDMATYSPSHAHAVSCGGTERIWYLEATRPTIDGGVSYWAALEYTWNGNDVVLLLRPKFGYTYLNKGNSGASMSLPSTPRRIAESNTKLYTLMKSSASNVLYMTEWLLSDIAGANPYTNVTFTATSLEYASVANNYPGAAAFHIDKMYNKIYTINPIASLTGAFPRPNDLYHARLPWTNAQTEVLPDSVNTTPAYITGIWSFPPYVYIAKMAGGQYGNQLIKFYDPDLVPPDAPVASATPAIFMNLISWTTVVGAASYNIYWRYSPGVTTLDTSIVGVSSPYSHMGLSVGIPIYYVVTAVDSNGVESVVSNEVSATPFGPNRVDGRIIW